MASRPGDKPPISDPAVLRRMAIAFDLFEVAEQMMRQNLRRRNPSASDEEIERGVRELFASSGIEPEVVAGADRLEILPHLVVPVASVGHLLALKVLALRPDRPHERPQDFADLRELLRVARADDLDRARHPLQLVSTRGYDRGRTFRRRSMSNCAIFRMQTVAPAEGPAPHPQSASRNPESLTSAASARSRAWLTVSW